MTPRISRANQKAITIRRRRDTIASKRRAIGLKTYLKKLLGGGRVQQRSIAAGPASSWICTSSTSWTDVKIVEMTNSEICAAEFASWTIFDEDIGNDYFLGECMRLFNLWQWFLEEIEEEDSESDTYYGLESLAESKDTVISSASDSESWTLPLPMYDVSNGGDDEDSIFCGHCDGCVDQRAIYTALFDEDDDEEIEVEPEPHDSLLMAALLSMKELLPTPAGVVRALSCPLLFDTRHLDYVNERLSLPSPPKWMTALETDREMGPPNSLVSTVSLPSGWDAVSARLSSSSIFNLFSDRPASPIPSLFSIDPTGAPSSTTGSTVSVPSSFWDSSSTVSVTGSVPQSSMVSIPSTFFGPREVTSSSMSSLFMDPSSAHSILSIDPSGCSSTSSSSLPIETTSSSSSLPTSSDCGSECVVCQTFDVYDEPRLQDCGGMSRRVDRSEDDLLKTHTISGASSGYESEVDSEPVVLKKITTVTSTQANQRTLALARMLAECDEMREKVMIMKKNLREMM